MDASKDDALNGWDAPRIWLRQNLGKMEELLYDGYSKHQEPRIFKKWYLEINVSSMTRFGEFGLGGKTTFRLSY